MASKPMFLFVWFAGQILVFLACFGFTQATLFIDDSNTTILYTGPSWTPYSSLTAPEFSWVGDPRVFKGTLSHSNCTTADNCHVKVTFTGVGITVYNVFRSSINLSMSLDQGPPTFFTFQDDLQCLNINTNTQACYNQSTYDSQSLDYGTHMLDITLLSPSDLTHYPYSDYFLDYIAINDTNPNSTITPTTTPTSTPTNLTQSSISGHRSRNEVGGIVGGVVAGIVLVAALLLFLQLHRRRVAQTQKGPNDPEFRASSTFKVDSRPKDYPNVAVMSPFLAVQPPRVPMTSKKNPYPQVDTTAPASTELSTDSGSEPRGPTTESHTLPMKSIAPYEPTQPRASSSVAPSSIADSAVLESTHLSNEQVEFVHDLYRMNIPAPAIAGVMGRMLREGGEGSDYPQEESPPGYNEVK